MEFSTFAVLARSPSPRRARAWPQNLETSVTEQGQKTSLDHAIYLGKGCSHACTNLALQRNLRITNQSITVRVCTRVLLWTTSRVCWLSSHASFLQFKIRLCILTCLNYWSSVLPDLTPDLHILGMEMFYMQSCSFFWLFCFPSTSSLQPSMTVSQRTWQAKTLLGQLRYINLLFLSVV